jgi:hypothetical protein
LRPGTRPGADGGGQQIRPGGDNRPGRPGGDDRPFRPGDNTRPTRPGQGGSGEQWRPGDRPGGDDWAHNRPDHINDWNQWNNWRQNNFTEINNHWHNNWNNYGNWFNRSWWDNCPNFRWRYPTNFNYWGVATWPAFTNWFPTWGWSEPVYYSYGDNVYYEGDQVYYGTQPVATAEEYTQQAEAIATSIPNVQPADSDWMSLGVFAMTPDGQPTGADPTMYLQLAVSKQGIISGTYQNTATNSVDSVEGMVDKQTQRAAWTAVGKTRPLMETGLVNLTEDSAPALVHFADGSTQQWLLVRLDKPGSTAQTPPRPNQ